MFYCLCLPCTSLSHILFWLFDDTLKMWKSPLACELNNIGVKATDCQLLCSRAAVAGPGSLSELQTPAQHSVTVCVLGTLEFEKHYAAVLLFPYQDEETWPSEMSSHLAKVTQSQDSNPGLTDPKAIFFTSLSIIVSEP